MRNSRNPFYMRFAEEIGSDPQYLRLFSSNVLDCLPPDSKLWGRITWIRSSPGGGKTSMLRLFRPAVLRALVFQRQDNEHYADLFARLRHLGAVDEQGPRVLGSLLSCKHNYSLLEDLAGDSARGQQLLLALLNARIIIAALRAAVDLTDQPFPLGLESISIAPPNAVDLPPTARSVSTAAQLYEWASEQESRICDAIDTFLDTPPSGLFEGSGLFSLWLISPDALRYRGEKISEHSLVMLDDVHLLSVTQRAALRKLLATLRAPTTVWLAERLEALSVTEHFGEGNKEGRDWNQVFLEVYWRANRKRFERFARAVANQRADLGSNSEITAFDMCLEGQLHGRKAASRLVRAAEDTKKRIATRFGRIKRYQQWITTETEQIKEAPPRDAAIGWRTLEILIERDRRKSQREFQWPDEQLETRNQADVRAAAELFLHAEARLPYYFGFGRLCALGSSNIEQFLALAGELFDSILSHKIASALARRSQVLTADVQERILRQVVGRMIDDAFRRLPQSQEPRALIESIVALCREQTIQPNAPYSPGVTGIAISMRDRARLADADYLKCNRVAAKLARAISGCIAENLLEPVLDQRCKGERWMLLYLNRAFCLEAGLPLQYGGWRNLGITTLVRWLGHEGGPSH